MKINANNHKYRLKGDIKTEIGLEFFFLVELSHLLRLSRERG